MDALQHSHTSITSQICSRCSPACTTGPKTDTRSSSSLSAVLYARRWSCCRPVIALSRVVAHRINLSTTLLGSHQCHLRVISEFINSRHDVVRLTRPRYILTILSRPHGLALPKTSALTLGDFRLNQPSTGPRSPRLVLRCSGYLLDNKTWRSQQY